MRCKGDDGVVLFSYDSFFNTVDIGGYPTYHAGEPWVDFIDVEDDGFVAIDSQKGYDLSINDIRTKKNIHRYREGEGFASWYDVPPKEVARIQSLDDLPSRKPSVIFDDCGTQLGGEFIQMLGVILRV